MERAVQLLVEIAGAEVMENGYDCLADIEKREDIKLRGERRKQHIHIQWSIWKDRDGRFSRDIGVADNRDSVEKEVIESTELWKQGIISVVV